MRPPMAGWITFAGVMMLVIGTLDFFEGLIAVVRDNYYVIHGNQLIVFDTTTWGWITMIWGIALVLVGPEEMAEDRVIEKRIHHWMSANGAGRVDVHDTR